MTQKTIFSGIQPTGNLHLGNYLGAIKQWQNMQTEDAKRLFCIVDLHAITVPQNSINLKESILKTVAMYIACGIDPNKNTIFVQSAVPQHAQLAWLLSCFCPIGWLNRMTQFKEKSGTNKEKASLALYSYPVLMAADILLYNTTDVPVGEDQKQHIELARDIALKFNNDVGIQVFTIPKPVINGHATRVMSLKDGTKKMSKSDESDYSRINLLDAPDIIQKKLQKAKSDSFEDLSFRHCEPNFNLGEAIQKNHKDWITSSASPSGNNVQEIYQKHRPEAANLLKIYAALTNKSFEETLKVFSNEKFSTLKQVLANEIIKQLTPIQNKYKEVMNNKHLIQKVVLEGEKTAKNIALKTLEKANSALGLGL